MKRLITLVTALLIASFSAFSQDFIRSSEAGELKGIFRYVAHMPEAGYNVNEYLAKSIRYPTDAMLQNISGRVVLRFVIDENGLINEVTVQKSVCPSIDSEAVRVVKNMPKWKPGRNEEDKPVKVYFTLPIKFSLGGGIPGNGGHSSAPSPYTPYYIPPVSAKHPISGPVLSYAEQMPDPGVSINSYIASQVTSSNIAELVGTKGRVVLKFIVTTSGDLDSFKVIKSLNPAVDTLAITILDNMPLWKPAMNEGKTVNVYYTTPIPFNFVADTNTQPAPPLIANEEAPGIYEAVEVAPEPLFRMSKYLVGAIEYPQDASRIRKQGTVVVKFIVDEEGHISRPTVIKSVFPSLDAEAIRVVRGMPRFSPGKVNGKPVKTYSSLAVNFYL